MSIDTIARRLLDLEVFRGLAPEQLERTAREADRIIFRDGQTMAEAGGECDGALVIVMGNATAATDEGEVLAIEAGTMVGEMGMLTEHHYATTIVAKGEVRAIKIMRETLAEQMRADAALRQHFLGRVASRLSRVAVELRLIDERLAVAAQHGARVHG